MKRSKNYPSDMDKMYIDSISYPVATQINTANGVIFGRSMKTFAVGMVVWFWNNESSVVSRITPAEGGGYAVSFEDGRMLFINDCIEMEVTYKPFTADGDKQD